MPDYEIEDYNGYKIVAPDPVGEGGIALNENFKKVADDIAALRAVAGDLTAGRVVLVGEGGVLTDSAEVSWDTSFLHVLSINHNLGQFNASGISIGHWGAGQGLVNNNGLGSLEFRMNGLTETAFDFDTFRGTSGAIATFANHGVVKVTIGTDGDIAAPSFSGSGAGLTSLNAGNIASGSVPLARLGTGAANATTFLRGDGAWAAPTATIADNTSVQKLVVSKAGTTVGTRKQLNFVQGANTTLTMADDAANDRVNVMIAAPGQASSFGLVAVAGQNYVSADSPGDTLTLNAGSGIAIATDSANDAITISVAGGLALSSLSDVSVSGLGSGPNQFLNYNGSNWEVTLTPTIGRPGGGSGADASLTINHAGGGTSDVLALSDGTTSYIALKADGTIAGKRVTTAQVVLSPVNVAYAATVTPNVDVTEKLIVGALTGNLTVADWAGTPADRQVLSIRWSQDATGGRTISWGSKYLFTTAAPQSAITTTASKHCYVTFEYNAALDRMVCTSVVPGVG